MAAPYQQYDFFVTCAHGFEPMLADEMRALRTRGVRPQRSGVLFKGTLKDAYRVCLWSRLASRVLLNLGDVDARNAETLYAGIKEMPWEQHLNAHGSLIIQTTGSNDALRNTQFTNAKVKDAIADRFRELFGRRPNVDRETPDLTINVLVHGDSARVSLDLSGEPLHRRGYRQEGMQVAAPMKETLAAAMLIASDWPAIAREGGALVDVMCGSATLLIEGALIAGDIAPGLLRRRWGFQRWLLHDEDAWSALLDEAERRAQEGKAQLPLIAGSDFDARALEVARRCVRRARLEQFITLERLDMNVVRKPELAHKGLVALNPPYGERLASTDEVCDIYRAIAQVARREFSGWRLAIITPDARLSWCLRMEPDVEKEFFNGRILSPVRVYTIGEPVDVPKPVIDDGFGTKKQHPEAFGGKGERLIAPKFDIDTTEVRNRLIKMKKHREKWARKNDVTCYRIYDADLPDFNCAIDIYQGAGPSEGRLWVRIAEYMAPHDIDPRLASARMEALKQVCVELFETPERDVILKQRKRQRGKEQYFADVKEGPIIGLVREGGLIFEVNLNQYLDTGLFLDHRDVRAYVRSLTEGTSFLNLFAYTGVATVYAADGGARATTTVDMSKTYITIAGNNLARNGFEGEEHRLIQSDVFAWIKEAREASERYDVIFCDPPTFSNSKRMDATWDVARDHVRLLTDLRDLLAPDGTLIFSNNKRGFTLDTPALEAAGYDVRDITNQTMPRDFEKSDKIHTCFTLTHR